MTPRLDPPVAVDLVPAEQVRDIITRTDVELTELESSAAELSEAVRRAEQAVDEAGLDPESSAWTMVRLQRFLEGLREETEREVDTMLELARQQARMRMSERGALYTTDRSRAAAPTPNAHGVPAPSTPVAPATPPVPAAPTHPFVPTPAGASGVPNGKASPTTPDPRERLALGDGGEATAHVAWAAPAAATAAATAPAVAPEAAPAQAPKMVQEASPRLTLVSTPLVEEPVPPAPIPDHGRPSAPPIPTPSFDAAPVTTTAPAATEPVPAPTASAAPAARQKSGFLRRLPISAILEVIAVLLILVFILLRLS